MPDPSTRDQLIQRGLDHLLADGSADASLRGLASGIGTSHSLLLYHFGSRDGLLAEIHRACDSRLRETLGRLVVTDPDPSSVVRLMWREMADPALFPLYRLSTGLRMRAADNGEDLHWWVEALRPVIAGFGVPPGQVGDEATLWIAVTRGLLAELATGLDPEVADRAAERFFAMIEGRSRGRSTERGH